MKKDKYLHLKALGIGWILILTIIGLFLFSKKLSIGLLIALILSGFAYFIGMIIYLIFIQE